MQPIGCSSRFAARLSKLYEIEFPSFARSLPSFVDHSERVVAAIDCSFALGEEGFLAYGWKLIPQNNQPLDITAHDEYGNSVTIKEDLLMVFRHDIADGFGERFSDIPIRCGFFVHVPLSTDVGEVRAICFHYPVYGDVWLGIQPTSYNANVELLYSILEMIQSPERLMHHLYGVFDGGLGVALESLNQQRLAEGGLAEGEVRISRFGGNPILQRVQ